MNKRFFFLLLLLALAAHGQEQKRLAIVRTEDDGEPPIEFTDLDYLTQTLREIAGNVLQNNYAIMTEQTIISKLGDNASKACKEASGCLAQLGRKISADYIGQARLGRFSGNLTISVQLYNSISGMLVGTINGNAKDLFGLLAVLNEKAPGMFGKMPGISNEKAPSASYATNTERYMVIFNTEPSGGTLSFDGDSVASYKCTKTPCQAMLKEGKVRIIAALAPYKNTDTTVLIKPQHNRSIIIGLKPNEKVTMDFSVNLTGIKGAANMPFSLFSYRPLMIYYFHPSVPTCQESYPRIQQIAKEYEQKGLTSIAVSVSATSKKEILMFMEEQKASIPFFQDNGDFAKKYSDGVRPIVPRLFLVYPDGKILRYRDFENEHFKEIKTDIEKLLGPSASSAAPAASGLKDSRDGKTYKTVKIGKQTWMAENLNYNASGSKCYENKEINCQKYGRLYNWNTAKNVCPKGWHLPNDDEWDELMSSVGDEGTAGKYLKAKSGWSNNGNGLDKYGFSALPGGSGHFLGGFDDVDSIGFWWSSSEGSSDKAYGQGMIYSNDSLYYLNDDKSLLFSVRCLQD